MRRGRATIPFFVWVLLEPVVQVMQLVGGVVLESNSRRGCPFRVLLRDSLLCNASHVYGLALPQLHDAASCAHLICDNRSSHLVIGPVALDDKIPRVDLHDLVALALCVERENHRAIIAVSFAVAITRVDQIAYAF